MLRIWLVFILFNLGLMEKVIASQLSPSGIELEHLTRIVDTSDRQIFRIQIDETLTKNLVFQDSYLSAQGSKGKLISAVHYFRNSRTPEVARLVEQAYKNLATLESRFGGTHLSYSYATEAFKHFQVIQKVRGNILQTCSTAPSIAHLVMFSEQFIELDQTRHSVENGPLLSLELGFCAMTRGLYHQAEILFRAAERDVPLLVRADREFPSVNADGVGASNNQFISAQRSLAEQQVLAEPIQDTYATVLARAPSNPTPPPVSVPTIKKEKDSGNAKPPRSRKQQGKKRAGSSNDSFVAIDSGDNHYFNRYDHDEDLYPPPAVGEESRDFSFFS